MTGAPMNRLPNGDREVILAAINDLGQRIERRFEKVEEDIKVLKSDTMELKLTIKMLPTYWHMYVAIAGLVVTVFSLMRFAMPTH